MAEYPINKGIGRPVEFKGLKAQYLFIFAGGLLAAFILFVILYMAGAGQWLCIGFGVVSASATVWLTFRLNAKYGEHGLMKLGAARMRPRHVLHRRRVCVGDGRQPRELSRLPLFWAGRPLRFNGRGTRSLLAAQPHRRYRLKTAIVQYLTV